jgi:uncharacterized lipoprotein YmbA
MLANLLVAGCATTAQSRFYSLNAASPPPTAASGLSLALGPIDLPEYLDRPQIVTRNGGNRLTVDEFNRWGGSLEEEIGRVLALYLGRRLGAQHVYSYPSRVAADTDYRIALDIRGFDGALGGEVGLDVAWSLIDDRGPAVLQTRQTSYRSVAQGPGYDAYAAALSDTLMQLGDDLASALAGLPPRPGP